MPSWDRLMCAAYVSSLGLEVWCLRTESQAWLLSRYCETAAEDWLEWRWTCELSPRSEWLARSDAAGGVKGARSGSEDGGHCCIPICIMWR